MTAVDQDAASPSPSETDSLERWPRWMTITAIAVSTVFVLSVVVSATRLTLYWDDYDILLNQSREGWSSIFFGNSGHVGALSKALLATMSFLFGFWYPGYALVNSLLAVATFWLFARSLDIAIQRWKWMILVASLVYLLSMGVLITTQVAICLEWFVASALAAWATYAMSRGKRPWLWILLLGLSWLAMSGLTPVYATMFAVVYLIVHTRGDLDGTDAVRRAVPVAAGVIVAAFAAAALGSLIASWLTTPYYANHSGAPVVPVPTSPTSIAAATMYLTAAWTLAPVTVILTNSVSGMIPFTFIFAARPIPFFTMMSVAAVLVLIWLMRKPKGTRIDFLIKDPWWLMVLPVWVWALQLATARSDFVYLTRYMLVWILPATLLWLLFACRRPTGRLDTVLRGAVAGLLCATAVWSVVTGPRAVSVSPDVDKARSTLSVVQRERHAECIATGTTTPVDQIAPGFSGEEVCEVARYLHGWSLQSRLAPSYT